MTSSTATSSEASLRLPVVVIVGIRWRHVRLGPDEERPRYSMFAWASMLFAAGIGTDIMFFAVAEPVSQYLAPPQVAPESLAAAEQAPLWTMFHYGLHGWGMYVLMGMAMGFVSHRLGLPLAVRSTLEPLFGHRTRGPVGDAVDVATVVATIFGLATSLGIGVVMLTVGLDLLLGTGRGPGCTSPSSHWRSCWRSSRPSPAWTEASVGSPRSTWCCPSSTWAGCSSPATPHSCCVRWS